MSGFQRVGWTAVLCVFSSGPSHGATFVGQTEADFHVSERLDGTMSGVQKRGPVAIRLTTDYTTMRWSIDFNVDLLMAGGPGQPFETRLAASGSLTSRRCAANGSGPGCSLAGSGDPSPLSFPDGSGTSGAGSYFLLGTAEWTLADRIVNATRERVSPSKAIVAAGGVGQFGGEYVAYGGGNQYLSVAGYPDSIALMPYLGDGGGYWQLASGYWSPACCGAVHLGRIVDDQNDVQVWLENFGRFTLHEALPGDLNGSLAVDAADYVTWRDAAGPLAPFLTSYDVWRANFGASLPVWSAAVAVPEPVSVALVVWLLPWVSRGRR